MQTTDENLATVLAQLARRTPDGQLVMVLVAGIASALAAVLLRPPVWFPMLAAATCLLSFGAWGIVDRVLQEDPAPVSSARWLLRATRFAAVALGLCGGMALVFGLLGLALGTWIS
jgi:hypothetical protein